MPGWSSGQATATVASWWAGRAGAANEEMRRLAAAVTASLNSYAKGDADAQARLPWPDEEQP
jgi:hypothetical protein